MHFENYDDAELRKFVDEWFERCQRELVWVDRTEWGGPPGIRIRLSKYNVYRRQLSA